MLILKPQKRGFSSQFEWLKLEESVGNLPGPQLGSPLFMRSGRHPLAVGDFEPANAASYGKARRGVEVFLRRPG